MKYFSSKGGDQESLDAGREVLEAYMKGSRCVKSLENHKIRKICRVGLTNSLKIKPCSIILTDCNRNKIKWYRKKIGGILPEVRLPKVALRKINNKPNLGNEPWTLDGKPKFDNEPWTLAGFQGDPYLNAEYFRILLQTPTSRKINKKLIRKNEPWVLEGFIGDPDLNSEHFRLLQQSPT